MRLSGAGEMIEVPPGPLGLVRSSRLITFFSGAPFDDRSGTGSTSPRSCRFHCPDCDLCALVRADSLGGSFARGKSLRMVGFFALPGAKSGFDVAVFDADGGYGPITRFSRLCLRFSSSCSADDVWLLTA